MAEDKAKEKEQKPAKEVQKVPAANKRPGGMKVVVGGVVGLTKIDGLQFDFNSGARVKVPEGNWRVRFIDRKACVVVCDMPAENAVIAAKRKYFIDYRIEVYREDKLVFEHNYNAKGRRVLFKNISNAMGDSIAWVPYVEEFRRKHGCEAYYAMSPKMAQLLAPNYPEIHFIGPDDRPEGLYASYYIGCFFPTSDRGMQPLDWRILGLQRQAAYLLDLPPVELRTHIVPQDKKRRIKEPYVCIAAQASSQPKYWNNPTGWYETVQYLKKLGYRVLCIDRDRFYGKGYHQNSIPYGAEDFTGDMPLEERASLIYHADFFVGLASGLSWLAWAVGRPVVMISGFSSPMTEFYTPYRVINYHVCHSCWEDMHFEFDHGDFEWCPRHKGDEEHQFECTRSIGFGQVRNMIDQLRRDYDLQTGKPAGTKQAK